MADSVYILDAPDIERIIIEYMKKYIHNDLKFADAYESVNSVRISEEHPFAAIINQRIEQGDDSSPVQVDTSLFPSITVVCTRRENNPEVDVPVPTPRAIRFKPEFLDDVKTRGRSQFIVGKEALSTFETAMNNSEDGTLTGRDMIVYRRAHIAVEIWALNMEVKDKLFDIVDLFIAANRKPMYENYAIMVHEWSISGERSGMYDFSFGRMLHGATLDFVVDYTMAVYFTEALTELTDATVEVKYT